VDSGCIQNTPPKFVDGKRLLEVIFDDASRPSLRWLRGQQARRAIPFVRLGRLIFFNPEHVLESLNARSTIRSKKSNF